MPSTSKKQHNFMTAIAHSPAFAKKVGVPMSVGKDFTKADKGRKFKDGGMAHTDIKEDKKLIKRAFKMHDAQEHKGEHTNLSKLKKGGIAMKKTFKDMEKREVEFMRKKGAPTSMIKHEKKEMSEEQGEPMCGGGKVKKMAAGGKAKLDPKVVATLNAQAARGAARPAPVAPMARPAPTVPMAAPAMARPPMAPTPVRPPMAPTPAAPMKKGGLASKVRNEKEEIKRVKAEEAFDKSMMKMAKGGRTASKGEHSIQTKSKRGAIEVKMAGGGFVKSADGCAVRGLTRAMQPKMAGGGKTKKYC